MGLTNPGYEGWTRGTLIAISAFERAPGLDRYRHGSTGGLLVTPPAGLEYGLVPYVVKQTNTK